MPYPDSGRPANDGADGKTIIFIAHSLDEVLEVADRITVLRDGKVIDTVTAADTDTHQVAEMMVGRPVLLQRVEGKAATGGPMLQVKDVRVVVRGKELLAGLDLDVRRSEIYGLAGVEGNGQAELVEVVMGMREPSSGVITLDGVDISDWQVREIREAGVGAIFVETTVNDRLARVVADETGATLHTLYTDALGPAGSGADSYIGFMRTNVRTIVAALSVP